MHIAEILDSRVGKKEDLTGSCLFLSELMRCQGDFSMPVPALSGLGVSCSTPLGSIEIPQ